MAKEKANSEEIEDTYEEDEEEDGKKKNRLPLYILIAFLMSGIIMYFVSSDFKKATNGILSKVPVVGSMFEDKKVEKTKDQRVEELASYYLTMDVDRAVDKLIAIKKDDKKLYEEIISEMIIQSQKQGAIIKSSIEEKEKKKDLLQEAYDSMEKEKLSELQNLAKEYNSQGLIFALKDFQNRFLSNYDFEEAALLLENLKPDFSAKILYHMNSSIAPEIENGLKSSYRKDVEREKRKYEEFIRKNQSKAQVYSKKDVEIAAKELSNQENFAVQDLSVIFSNMDYLAAAKILNEFEDKDYVKQVLDGVKETQDINSTITAMAGQSEAIAKSMKIYGNFEKDVDKLKKAYEKMDALSLANMIVQMGTHKPIKSNEYKIDDTRSFKITEEDMMIVALKKMKPDFLSQVIKSIQREVQEPQKDSNGNVKLNAAGEVVMSKRKEADLDKQLELSKKLGVPMPE